MITIGITAVGGGVGQNVLASLRASNLRARVVGFDASPWGVGVHECDAAYRLPLPNDPAYVPTLLSRCREEKVALLIPGSDSELPILARCAPDLETIGCRVLVSGPECVRICRDKLATYRELAPRGAPIVETWAPEEAEPHARDLPYPLVAKPCSGSASRGVVILMRPEDWARLPRCELLFEINARFSGSTYHRALPGYNEVEAAVRYFALGQGRDVAQRMLRPRIGWVALRQVHGCDVAVPLERMTTFETEGRLSNVSRSAGDPTRRRARRRGHLARGRAAGKSQRIG